MWLIHQKTLDSPDGNLLFCMLFQLLKKTPSQILNSDLGTFHGVDITSIQLALAERQSELPHTSRSAIPVILSDNETRFGSVRLVKHYWTVVLWELNGADWYYHTLWELLWHFRSLNRVSLLRTFPPPILSMNEKPAVSSFSHSLSFSFSYLLFLFFLMSSSTCMKLVLGSLVSLL